MESANILNTGYLPRISLWADDCELYRSSRMEEGLHSSLPVKNEDATLEIFALGVIYDGRHAGYHNR